MVTKFSGQFPRVTVIGGAGFIGSHLIDSLLEEGCFVKSVDDFSAGKSRNLSKAKKYGEMFEDVSYDISEGGKSLSQILDGTDLIFHQAASKMNICLRDPQRDLLVNAGGTLNLLISASEIGCKRFVHASTGSVYGQAKQFPTDESHALDPVSFYGVSKLAGEKYVRLFNDIDDLNTTILRYFHVYGPRQESNDLGGVVAIFIRNILDGTPIRIFGNGEQIRSFTYVSDLVNINKLLALDSALGGMAFNCASGIKVSINELAHKTRELMDAPNHPILYESGRPGDIQKFDIDNSLLRKLGFTWEIDFATGLRNTIDYFQNSGGN